MPLFQGASFHTTVANLADLPPDAMREIAFAGRSNAGKSSAINALANHSRLAFVSKTPGRTQHLNYFRLVDGKYLVDLPGYGFAKAPEEIRSQWEGLLAPYLKFREALTGLVLIMDVRHPLTDLDVHMLDWFSQTGKPIHVLLSKADKLTQQEQALAINGVRAKLAVYGELCSCQLFSSTRKKGIKDAEKVLAPWLDMEIKEELPPRMDLGKKPRARNRKAVGWSAKQMAGGKK